MNLTTRNRGYPIGPTHPWFSGYRVHLEHTPRKGLFQHIFEMCVFLALFLQSLDQVLASRAAFTHPGPGHKYLRARNVLACVHVAFVLVQPGLLVLEIRGKMFSIVVLRLFLGVCSK